MDNYESTENIPKDLWTEILLMLIKSETLPPYLQSEMEAALDKKVTYEVFAFSALSMPRLVNKKLRDCCRRIVRDTAVNQLPFWLRFAEYTCLRGYMNCLEYYVDCNGRLDKENLSGLAASTGNIDLLKYLLKIGCKFDRRAVCSSAVSNSRECMQFILDNGGDSTGLQGDFLGLAARAGALEAVKFGHEHGCHWYSEVICDAAKHGHIEIIKYAHEHGCGWSVWACLEAAQNGHLNCLKYAHEHGCAWYAAETCILAAENGHLDCLKYAHDEGCPWDNDTCRRAMKNNQLHIVKYLHENGCPCEHNKKS